MPTNGTKLLILSDLKATATRNHNGCITLNLTGKAKVPGPGHKVRVTGQKFEGNVLKLIAHVHAPEEPSPPENSVLVDFSYEQSFPDHEQHPQSLEIVTAKPPQHTARIAYTG